MPTNYSGNPANVTTPLTAIVSNVINNSGTIEIITTAAHFFSTHDYVQVLGVNGVGAANTTAQITVISTTAFLLNGTTFSGSYVSGGTATDLSLTPYFQVPSDGESGTVEGILASIQALADRTQYLESLIQFPFTPQQFTASTGSPITPPYGAHYALLVGCGGGGGGSAGGAGQELITGSYPVGSGGGGAGIGSFRVVQVSATTQYDIVIGAGGVGGIGTSGVGTPAGTDGGVTTFAMHASAVLATFEGGGAGGYAGLSTGSVDEAYGDASTIIYSLGGSAAGVGTNIGSASVVSPASNTPFYSTQHVTPPGCGGAGSTRLSGTRGTHGGTSPEGFAGGQGGLHASVTSSFEGGGGGGGGAGGPFGAGGNGGDGGAPNASGNGSVGANGVAPSANTGAGGGGGGAGGSSSTAFAASGGHGGNGGSGKLTIYWIR